MSQLDQIRLAQDSLEDSFSKRMAELEMQLQSGGAAKDTVAKVAEEFRTFRELMFSMLGLLRKQIEECAAVVDDIETRQRRKSIIFLGINEAEKEDCRAVILDKIRMMGLKDVTAADVAVCHRVGVQSNGHHRPVLVKFSNYDNKAAVWRSKSSLKGTTIAIKEFLTRTRQSVFAKARLHFGMRGCWTQDGTIVVKAADGTRHKFTTMHQLNTIMLQFPKSTVSSTNNKITGPLTSQAATSVHNKPRK